MNKPQAIAGVSSQRERTIAVTYPSISSSGGGQLFGLLFNSIPIGFGKVKLSHLIFVLPLAPITALLYLLQKCFGRTYEVTNRSVHAWGMWFGTRSNRSGSVALSAIDRVEIEQKPGQVFFNAANLHLLSADGRTQLVLTGVVNPRTFRETILKARDARRHTDSALTTIQARKPA